MADKATKSVKEAGGDAPKETKTIEDKEPELSDEDKQLQEELNMLVERLREPDQGLYRAALESLRSQIRSSTTSMTSVPKPLKFLRPHYDTLKDVYTKIKQDETKQFCADIISVLGMTMSDSFDCLEYRLLGSAEEIGSWGHEYVRHLAGEIAQKWQVLEPEDTKRSNDLLLLIKQVVPHHMRHNAEAEACDLLMETDQLALVKDYIDHSTYQRVCQYLTSCVAYVAEPENVTLLKTAVNLYRQFNELAQSVRYAMQLNDMDLVKEIFDACQDVSIKRQLAYMLGQQHIYVDMSEDDADFGDLSEMMSNGSLSRNFLTLASELDIMEAKVPEDIYKTHLEPNRTTVGPTNIDSARQNLASSFVNGFVNAAFGQDKLLKEDGIKWLHKNREHGMLSATASLGLILLWDVDGGLAEIEKYFHSTDKYIQAGALVACGVVNAGVRHDCDPCLALLSDYIGKDGKSAGKPILRTGAIMGIGLAYAGSNREEVISLLLPVLADSRATMETIGITGLSLGLVCVGSCNGDVTSTILQTMMERNDADIKDNFMRFLALGLALNYLGKQDAADVALASLEVTREPMKSMARLLVDICAYTGTGNVLKVQELLHICSEHDEKPEKTDKEKDKKDDKNKDKKSEKSEKSDKDPAKADLSQQQAIAVLGIALIAAGEDIGTEMSYRAFGHLLRYGEPVIRRAVPLALALLYASNPSMQIIDTLSKFSHDSDAEVSHCAILAMGIVGAGTNNARLAAMLRQLAVYHAKDANNLFLVRIAQGLTHLGKGTLTLCPFNSDRALMSPVAVAALVSVLVSCLDIKNTILSKSHYILYYITAAIHPRMLITFDEQLEKLPVPIRVGQAVDVVGQAGKPKTITGFQTHTTPVLLAYGERAELVTEEYIALTPIMEGSVILRKNPDYEA